LAVLTPVCDGTRLVGMITDRDITVRGVAEGKAPSECSVSDVMTQEVSYAFEDDDVQSVALKMGQWQVHRLRHVLPLYMAGFAQSLAECDHQRDSRVRRAEGR
jgi:CBS domain-containing protein